MVVDPFDPMGRHTVRVEDCNHLSNNSCNNLVDLEDDENCFEVSNLDSQLISLAYLI